MAKQISGTIVLLLLSALLVQISSGQGPPPPGGVRVSGGGSGGPPDTEEMSLSKKVIQVLAKHVESKLPTLNTDTVVRKVKTNLGISTGNK